MSLSLCVCARACVCACVCECARARLCARACVHACGRPCVCVVSANLKRKIEKHCLFIRSLFVIFFDIVNLPPLYQLFFPKGFFT